MLAAECLALGRARALWWVMARREITARYAGTAAGVLWAYIQPLLMVAAYYLVFDVVFAMRLGDNAPTTAVGAYLVVGSLPWMAFCDAVSRGMSSLVEAGGVLQKNALPPVLFPAKSVLASMVVFGPLLLALVLGYGPQHGFAPALLSMPLLVGLRKQFTTYQLQQASALRSVYSWRLLELLMRFKSSGKAEYTVEDFAASMDATEKQRADFSKLRTKMIEPAVKELTEKDGWLIQWEPIKAGRKVKAVRFTFMRNPQGSLDL